MENGFRFIATSTCITNFSPGVAERRVGGNGVGGTGMQRQVDRHTYWKREREFRCSCPRKSFQNKANFVKASQKLCVICHDTRHFLFEGYLSGNIIYIILLLWLFKAREIGLWHTCSQNHYIRSRKTLFVFKNELCYKIKLKHTNHSLATPSLFVKYI